MIVKVQPSPFDVLELMLASQKRIILVVEHALIGRSLRVLVKAFGREFVSFAFVGLMSSCGKIGSSS